MSNRWWDRHGTLVQFVALAATWGASFLFVAVALRQLSPQEVVLGRLVVGAVTLGATCLALRQPLPRDLVVWGHLAVVSLLLCVVPFSLFAWAQQEVTSGLASIFNATTPLMTSVVALALLPQERPTRVRAAGLAVGLAGVLVVIGPWRQAVGGSLAAQGAGLAATACYGLGFVHLRRFVSPRGLPAVPVAAVQVGLGALLLVLAAPWTVRGPVPTSWPVGLSVLALGALGTGLAYVWNTRVVAGWGATNASTVTYLTPLVGVLLGVVVLSERVAWNQPVGAVVVVLGIAMSQGRLRRRQRVA